jgi:hypothetical protein
MTCPYDNPNCPRPGQPVGFGHHAACLDAEVERARVAGASNFWPEEQRLADLSGRFDPPMSS